MFFFDIIGLIPLWDLFTILSVEDIKPSGISGRKMNVGL